MVRDKKNAQVTLEFALAIIGVVILFFTAATIFFYVNNRLVTRQQYYESSKNYGRIKAAGTSQNSELQVDEKALPTTLDFFKLKGFK
jgi:uncharacterized protein (UPF0333 family)